MGTDVGEWVEHAYIEHKFDGSWQGDCLLTIPGTRSKVTVTFAEGPTQEDVERQLKERWSSVQIVDREEFDRLFWPKGRPSKNLLQGRAGRNFERRPSQKASGLGVEGIPQAQGAPSSMVSGMQEGSDRPLPARRTLSLQTGESVDTMIAPVAIAKRLNVPPQYVYHDIAKGRLKTVGERPKKVRLGDVAALYHREVTHGD